MMIKAVLTTVLVLMSMTMQGQTYTALWKQADEAGKKDLPRTQYDVLMKIVKKAQKEGQYGQLMAAELAAARTMNDIAPDSLQPAVERIAARQQQAKDKVLATVYATVLKKICENNSQIEKSWTVETAVTLDEETCEKLAAVKAAAYEPLTVKGRDSRWFGDDMLSVVGYQLRDFQPLHDYYNKVGNRVATLMTALEIARTNRPYGRVVYGAAPYLQTLDSLIAQYGDLTECGEVAIARYDYMNGETDASAAAKWNYLQQALERWGGYERMNALRNSLQRLTNPMFEATLENSLVMPDMEQQLWCRQLRNISGLTVRIYRAKVNGDTALNPQDEKDYQKLKPLLTELPERRIERHYDGKPAYEVFEDSVRLSALPVGVYLIEVESTPATAVSRRLYYVSNVRTMVEALPGNQMRYVVVDAVEGQPVKGATIELKGYVNGRSGQKMATLTTDDKGEALYKWTKSRPTSIYTYTAADKACVPMSGSGNFYYYADQRRMERTLLFTDRAIYRPGQTVRVAAICYEVTNGIEQKTLENKKLTLTLRDANYKVVAEQTATTDRYGSCAADFTLPLSGLTGHFSITTADGSWSFRVEEYKRPTFEVAFDEVTDNYKDGDTVVVRAKARSYAGVPVQGAKVKYQVVRRRAFWWWAEVDEETMAEGEALTDGDGTFKVPMPMVLPKTNEPQFYNFVCKADVTDLAGETHQGQMSLPLSNRKTALSIDLPEQIRADKAPKLTFHLRNAAGSDVAAVVSYRCMQLSPSKGKTAKWLTAATNKPLDVPVLKSGRYTLEAVCEGDTVRQDYTVFSLDDQRPVAETDFWGYASDEQFPNDGSPVTIQVGSSAKDVHIVYTIISGDRVIESGTVERSNALVNRQFTYRPEYGGGLHLSFAWVKHNKFYRYETQIRRPLPDKRLKVEWQTFRDKLTPGQQEEWTLTVRKADGTPADAQFMATLYDKSLDQINAHRWVFTPYQHVPLPSTAWHYGFFPGLSLRGSQSYKALKVVPVSLTYFDSSLFPQRRLFTGAVMRNSRMAMAKTSMATAAVVEEAAIGAFDVAANDAVEEESIVVGYAAQRGDEAKADNGQGAEVQLRERSAEGRLLPEGRKNLQETAFFYPRLQADSTGLVTLKFTLPESLTTWRFMGLAHTSDLCYGQLSGEAVAKKELMVQPNVPRFIREGDKATITTRLINTGERDLSGTAQLTLIDPETEQVVVARSAPFSVEAGETASVTFAVEGLELTESLLIARVVASGDGFSDGEQHYLPVLPNRERVTVTVPFTQNEPGTKTIDLTKLVPTTVKDAKLTIEYTNNPAWLMIQALPAIGHPNDDCAICQAASLYANSIGKHIIGSLPDAKQTFELWKKEQGNETTLNSQLQKNQELKDLMLSETPWMLDADREEEQRQRLADFFDENLMQQRLTSAVDKLRKLQRNDGSWSWWPEMPGSVYMTMAVSEMLTRLNAVTRQPSSDAGEMLDGAFRFLGREMVKQVAEIKKQKKALQVFPGRTALQWLYICKLDGRRLPADVQQANQYLTTLLKKETKNQTIYEKALSAIILDNQTYVKSLKEYTVYKEEMGRYYDTPRAGYSWRDYRIPTQVAAIEAIRRLTPDDQQTLNEMRRWLLQEKRTQAWDTPLNSVDAVYAFLGEELKVKSEKSLLSLDGQPVDTPKATAGIGYVKTAQPYQGQKTFTAEKQSEGTSWGAVYAQFVQPTTDIKDAASGVSVKRELLTNLKVGDRVTVRLTIESERDLDFVMLQDKRAACMEPVRQLSGYNWQGGYYCTPRDNVTNYYFDRLPKGKRVIETEYYIDRAGQYETGTCTVQCAYAPEYRGTTKSQTINAE